MTALHAGFVTGLCPWIEVADTSTLYRPVNAGGLANPATRFFNWPLLPRGFRLQRYACRSGLTTVQLPTAVLYHNAYHGLTPVLDLAVPCPD